MRDVVSVTVPRTGDSPLAFQGEVIREVDGRNNAGQEQNRWHDLAVYRTRSGKYVLAISYFSRWQGESDHHEAIVCDTAEAVRSELKAYSPCQHVIGYPAGEAYTEKQSRLLTDITRRYGALVSELLESAEFTEWLE